MAAPQTALAQGGIVSFIGVNDNSYWVVHKFTSSGTFTKSTNATLNGYYLVVAGGGSGGYHEESGGGGGAGGMLTNWGGTAVELKTDRVTVGVGGAVASNGSRGNNGGNSSYNGIVAIGGGGGGVINVAGNSGGSGGGGSRNYSAGGAGTSGQGNSGATGIDWTSSGGGGAGSAGGQAWSEYHDGDSHWYGGLGGDGRECYILDNQSHWYAAGGGGGSRTRWHTGRKNGIGGAGGAGFEGDQATAGIDGTGSGGGGGGYRLPYGAAGGSGIVILRYLVTKYLVTKNATTNGTINNTTTKAEAWVISGESASYTVKPNTNYRINNLTVAGVSQSLTDSERNSGKTLSVKPTQNTTIAATFTLKPYVTINCGSGGTIKYNNSNTSSGYVDYNVKRTYTVTANSGQVISSIKINGTEQLTTSGDTSKSFSITPTANTTIVVEFGSSGNYAHTLWLLDD